MTEDSFPLSIKSSGGLFPFFFCGVGMVNLAPPHLKERVYFERTEREAVSRLSRVIVKRNLKA